MSEANSNDQTYTPPYVYASVFEKFLNLARQKAWPKVTVGTLQDNGFTKSQAYPLFTTLKVLGLIDVDGNSLPLMNELSASTTDSSLKETLKKIVETSYSDLVQNVVLKNADLDQIDEYFRRRGVAPTVARRSARFFSWLADLAGLEVAIEVDSKKRKTKHEEKSRTSKVKREDVQRGKSDEEIETITFDDVVSADDYEEVLLKILLDKASKSDGIPDPEVIRQIREIISERKKKETESKAKRHADVPVLSSKQENQEDA